MLKRFFHNALQTLRKDDGAHFAYNLGVSFVRFGAVLLGAAILLGLVFIINPTDLLRYKGKTQATLTSMHVRRVEHRGRSRGTTTTYYVSFNCTIGSTRAVAEQTVPALVYSKYEKLGVNNVIPARFYYSKRTGLYVTERPVILAQLEYGLTHPFAIVGYIAIWCTMGAIGVIGFGLNQERIGMKYPRTDVEIGETALVSAEEQAYIDELLDEFDEAYEKFKQNKAAGLPTSEPPRRKKEEAPLRLEKHDDRDGLDKNTQEPETK